MSAPRAERILIIRPSALGDVARSVPVLYSLRRAYPDATIDWVVQDSFADVVRAHPDLTAVVPYARRDGARGALRLARRLARAKYDLVLDCQGLARSGFFARATHAPVRVGHADARELGWLGLTHRVAASIEAHTVDRMLSLVTPLGVPTFAGEDAMRLYTPAEGIAWAAAQAWMDEPYVVLAATSRWPGKQWPAERFAEVAKHLAGHGYTVAAVGAESERGQVGPLLSLCIESDRVLDLVGNTSLAQMMAVVERSRLVVANDSAALHIAVGFGRPVVGLYGPTRVHRVGPYRRERDVIQHVTGADRMDHKDESNGRALMERISVQEVIEAVGARVARGGRSHEPLAHPSSSR